MLAKLNRLWKSLVSAETVEGVANASEKVFALAETLNDKENKNDDQIKPKTLLLRGFLPLLIVWNEKYFRLIDQNSKDGDR